MYQVACLGVQESLDQLQTKSGVKDSISLFWFNQLVLKAREMQKIQLSNKDTRDIRLRDSKLKGKARDAVKDEIKRDIQTQLMAWIVTQPPESYARLSTDSRMCSSITMTGLIPIY